MNNILIEYIDTDFVNNLKSKLDELSVGNQPDVVSRKVENVKKLIEKHLVVDKEEWNTLKELLKYNEKDTLFVREYKNWVKEFLNLLKKTEKYVTNRFIIEKPNTFMHKSRNLLS